MNGIHDRIEILAGAIALGEATDAERLEYREHIAACPHCLDALGGEHEIERVAQTVAAAREGETWSPVLGDVVARRSRAATRKIQYGVTAASIAIAASLGIHAIAASTFSPLSLNAQKPVAIDLGTTRIVLEQRHTDAAPAAATPARKGVAAAPQRQLVVLHNVVSMQRQPVTAARTDAAVPASTFVVVHPKQPAVRRPKSNRPVWDDQTSDSWRTVATTTTTSQMETAPQSFANRAESIQFNSPPAHDREASVVGGETAINPQPPMIAYDEGAEGTSVFEVTVDPRGNPVKCTITKSSDFLVLDNAVCKAAMSARYLPKIQDGRAVTGIYADAFTFRMQDDWFHSQPTASMDTTPPQPHRTRPPHALP